MIRHNYILAEDKEIMTKNNTLIDVLCNLFREIFSIKVCYGRFKNNTSIDVYIDNRYHSATEASVRFIGDLKSPNILIDILLFLNENYSKLGVTKNEFDAKYAEFLDWYVKNWRG